MKVFEINLNKKRDFLFFVVFLVFWSTMSTLKFSLIVLECLAVLIQYLLYRKK